MTDWIAKFDGRIDVSIPITDNQLARVPPRRGLLLLMSRREEPIILIPAANLRSRLLARIGAQGREKRRRKIDLRQVTGAVLWKLTTGHFETDLRFLELAQEIWPTTYTRLLAWRPAWFVHVDPAREFPRFVKTRAVLAAPGRYFGPFSSGRSAERFIEAVQDAFDLCRDHHCLMQAPNGQLCSYGQMGRCLAPCNGTIPMEEYRGAMARAAAFAGGLREEFQRQLRRRMETAAKALEFERAAALKARLARIRTLEGAEFRHVGAGEEFRFIMVQPGGSRRRAKVFLVDRGSIAAGSDLDYPPDGRQLARTLEEMASHARRSQPGDEALRRWRMGLVSHYLFSSEGRGGLIFRWNEGVIADELAEALERFAEPLKLRAPADRRKPSRRSDRSPPPDAGKKA